MGKVAQIPVMLISNSKVGSFDSFPIMHFSRSLSSWSIDQCIYSLCYEHSKFKQSYWYLNQYGDAIK